MEPFVPLHVHSHFSILDGASKVGAIVDRAVEIGAPAIAITDAGVMYGAIELYKKAKEAGIKPIIGCELFVIDGDPTNRDTKRPFYQIVALAKSYRGYQNLVKLVTKAQLEGFYYKPRINFEQLEAFSEDLIILTGGQQGILAYSLLRNNPQEAQQRAEWLKRVFGDNLYIELQDHGLDSEKRVNAQCIQIADDLNIPLVMTNESRYATPEGAEAHDIQLCMQQGKVLTDPSRPKMVNGEYYIKDAQQMRAAFPDLDEAMVTAAIQATVTIADACNVNIPMDESILPDYPVPDGMTAETYLRALVDQTIEERIGGEVTPDVKERLDYELGVINQMGFPAYFLITWDFINYARQNDIPVGPGRGSAAGSLVAFTLGITNINPIEHNLLFERFLNPERISMPDVDIDFCIDRREKVIEYVQERYGRERVSQIITFGTLAARAALKAVCRVLDVPFADSDRWAKMIPSTPGTKLKEALEDKMPLGDLYKTDEQVKRVVNLALQMEGLNSNTGIHAAGVVIAKDPLEEVVPLQLSKDGQVVTQYAMDDVAKLGLLKMDFLGLRNLTIIDQTLHLIEDNHHVTVDLDHVDLDDEGVYKMLASGDTDGVFQLESGGMKALVKDLKPTCFEDINALVALFRPGPLNSGMVDEFVKRKHGKSKVEFPHAMLEPILTATYGTIVYQEQIMQIAQTMAGYSLGQADLLRRAMGKKKQEEMEKQRELFLSGSIAAQVDEKLANSLFDDMTEFSKYCFNRSHSAAYAFIAYQTAYLKVHYPVEYLSALLSSVSNDQEKTQLYMLTARKMGIPILSPDINASNSDFTPHEGAIRFGLSSIKNVGQGVLEKILQVRAEKGPFTSFEDYCQRVDLKSVNRRVMESLIKVGAFDSFGRSRQQVLANLDNIYRYAERIQEQKETGQVSLFAFAASDSGADSGFADTIMWGSDQGEWPADEIQKLEKELLGFYVSSHPLDSVMDKLPLVATHAVKELSECADGTEVVIAGLISSMVQKVTKTNKPLRIGQLEDVTGSIEWVAFSDSIAAYDTLLAEGHKVVISAKLQFRGDDSMSVVVNQVRSLNDVAVVELALQEPLGYQDVMSLQDLLRQVKGTDPVVISWKDRTKMILGKPFWVDSTRVTQVFRDSTVEHPVKTKCQLVTH